jgi:D-alanyl-D-alanine carboxypeptidase/D-alanyl-D-alanine carboxypeptidase (penicillin-binding protein 5/6)
LVSAAKRDGKFVIAVTLNAPDDWQDHKEMLDYGFSKIKQTKFSPPYKRTLTNHNKLLKMYDGAAGVKTGFTKKSGRCLVSAATRNGMTLVCTVLNCGDTYGRSKKLLDDFFSAYQKEEILSKKEEFVIQANEREVHCRAREGFSYPLLNGEKEYIERKITPYYCHKDKEIVGQIEIFLLKRLLFCGNLYKL